MAGAGGFRNASPGVEDTVTSAPTLPVGPQGERAGALARFLRQTPLPGGERALLRGQLARLALQRVVAAPSYALDRLVHPPGDRLMEGGRLLVDPGGLEMHADMAPVPIVALVHFGRRTSA